MCSLGFKKIPASTYSFFFIIFLGFYNYCCCYCLVAQSCLTLCNSMDYNPSASLFTEFSRQEYWSGLPCPSPGRRSYSFRFYRVIEEGFIVIEPWFFTEHMIFQKKKKNSQPLLQMTLTITLCPTQGNVNVRYQLRENQHALFFPFSSMPLPPSCCLKCKCDGWNPSCNFG